MSTDKWGANIRPGSCTLMCCVYGQILVPTGQPAPPRSAYHNLVSPQITHFGPAPPHKQGRGGGGGQQGAELGGGRGNRWRFKGGGGATGWGGGC